MTQKYFSFFYNFTSSLHAQLNWKIIVTTNIGIDTGNKILKKLGVKEGNKVNFTKDSEYEFIINDEKLYRMRVNDICTILN